jgi:hypothetical protein
MLLFSFKIIEYNKWSPFYERIANKPSIIGSLTKKEPALPYEIDLHKWWVQTSGACYSEVAISSVVMSFFVRPPLLGSVEDRLKSFYSCVGANMSSSSRLKQL